jgi:hypothetical protein
LLSWSVLPETVNSATTDESFFLVDALSLERDMIYGEFESNPHTHYWYDQEEEFSLFKKKNREFLGFALLLWLLLFPPVL